MSIIKNAVAAICAGATVLAGAQAQQEIQNPKELLANFDVSSVGPVLSELGVTWQAGKTDTGQTYIAANAGGFVNFILSPAACRGDNFTDCVGLNMVAIFEGNPNPQTVRAFNYRYAFASAGIDPSGAAYISRYEISDYGMARGNLSTSIQVFANQVVRFGNELETARRTVALEGFADDLAAKELNRKALEEITGVEAHAENSIALHEQGLEDSAVAVRRFILDKAAPRNKIDNIKN